MGAKKTRGVRATTEHCERVDDRKVKVIAERAPRQLADREHQETTARAARTRRADGRQPASNTAGQQTTGEEAALSCNGASCHGREQPAAASA